MPLEQSRDSLLRLCEKLRRSGCYQDVFSLIFD